MPPLTWDQVRFKKSLGANGDNRAIRALHRACGIPCSKLELPWINGMLSSKFSHFDKRPHSWQDTEGRKCVSVSFYADEYGDADRRFETWLKQFTDVNPELVERYYNKNTNDEKLMTLYLHRNLIYIIRVPKV